MKMEEVKEIVKRTNTEFKEELEEFVSAKRQKFESNDEPINQEGTVTTSVQEIKGSNPTQETCSQQGTSKVTKIPTNNSGKGIHNRLPRLGFIEDLIFNPIRRLELEDGSSLGSPG